MYFILQIVFLVLLQTSLSKQLYLYANDSLSRHAVYLNVIRMIFIKRG